ncbi:PhoP regulatory network YrbL family protein [Aliarcobacter skirrowii]|uniref:PhoP regulatory network YrbL family protein n=1 Tax=Aliarcobacter skirrowii TaxID=28200 RepID=UPI0021B43799|nr:PhoP regulatory network YrbL family protein [Aliarcobacter skirrowii]MCT7447129.1 PhoP regulatory network YrbL family protein [Aliarcobacter skirrowii]
MHNKIIKLKKEIFFGKGGLREVYTHPNDDTKIIKVSMSEDNGQNELEYTYYESLKKRDVSYSHIPKCFGKVMTNLGEGLVFEKVVNYDGSNCLELKEAIVQQTIPRPYGRGLKEELKEYTIKNNIIYYDVSLDNMLLQEYEEGKYRLMIIDGLGGRYKKDFRFCLRINYRFLGHLRILERWKKLTRVLQNKVAISYENIFTWDNFSDQPHVIRDKEFKKRVRKHYKNDFLKMIFTSLYILPISIFVMKFFRGKKEVSNKELIGLGVNLDKDDGNNIQQEMVEDLGVKNLIIRIPLWDIENIDSYLDFAKSFNTKSKKNILLNIMQDRENITNRTLLRDNLEIIFEKFKDISNEFQIGTTINRMKWGFFSIKDDYIPFFLVAQKLRDEKYPDIKLLGASVIDFEYYYSARAMFNMKKIKFDITSSLLYVDRRGSPKNSQYLFFDLKNKIDMLFSLVKLSPKCKSDDIYITEVNWPIKDTAPYAPTSEKECVSLDDYTKYMLEYFEIAKNSKKIKRVYWHQLIASGYGLVDNRDGKIVKYPQYFAFKKLLENNSI